VLPPRKHEVPDLQQRVESPRLGWLQYSVLTSEKTSRLSPISFQASNRSSFPLPLTFIHFSSSSPSPTHSKRRLSSNELRRLALYKTKNLRAPFDGVITWPFFDPGRLNQRCGESVLFLRLKNSPFIASASPRQFLSLRDDRTILTYIYVPAERGTRRHGEAWE